MILRLSLTANETGERALAELVDDLETKEMFVERLEEHMSAAVSDAVFDMLGRRLGIDSGEYAVTIDGDTVPGLVLALQGALRAVEQGRGNEIAHLLRAAIARAANGGGGL